MTDFNPNAFIQPQQTFNDPLTDLLRQGARELIAKAVETELQILLEQHSPKKLPDGRQALVRNGYLPERTVQTGIGDVQVKVPKVDWFNHRRLLSSIGYVPPAEFEMAYYRQLEESAKVA